MSKQLINFKKTPIVIALTIALSSSISVGGSKAAAVKGVLPELQLNKKTEAENLKTAAEVETLISKSEEKAISQLETLLKKYSGTSQEPDLIFRLAELYARRAKTGRFVDLYRGEKTLAEILTPKLTAVGAKAYLSKAINNYLLIQKKYPKYPALDEVLFNLAFAYEQSGNAEMALKNFQQIVEKFQNSPLLPETHMALGELYFMKQNYSESLRNYEKVQEWPEAPIAPIALYKSSWCSYNLKNTMEAILKMEKLLLQSKERPLISHVRSEARRDLALFFSEVGEPKNSTSYFKKHLLKEEIGPTVLDLSNLYERHGKLDEMVQVLHLFLKDFSEDESAGSVYLRLVQHQNSALKFSLVIESLREVTKLCQSESWKKKTKETASFCAETYPNQLKELAAEWWENWNKLHRPSDMTQSISFIFTEYMKFESNAQWNVAIHISYADFLFDQKSYKEAAFHYEGVSKIEGLDARILPEALYGTIVSLDRVLSEKNKDQVLRQQLHLAINNYLTQCPKGEFVNDALFKKGYLFYEEREFDQSLLWISKINSTKIELKEKKEDLTLEIHRTKKDYQALEAASALILKSSTGDRYKKIKNIYQLAQQSIIQEMIQSNRIDEAIVRALSFYKEHRPEEKALDSIHLSIELYEKQKKFRLAGENSETLAKELKQVKKDVEADKTSQHAVQLFLQLGDLPRVQESLVLATDLALDEAKKKENLELSTEIATWYGNIEAMEKSWGQLEKYLSKDEKLALVDKRFRYYQMYAPDKALQMRKGFIEKGMEPYFSESQLEVAKKYCQEKKWSQCYQLSLKLNKDSTPSEVRSEARYLQTKVLNNEYTNQSLKAPADKMALVMSYKAEKFDKLVQVLNTVSQKSEVLSFRKQAVQDLIFLYNDYVTQLKKSMDNFDLNNPNLVSLKQEISQILPVLENRPKELELAMNELIQWELKEKKDSTSHGLKLFPQLVGTEMRVYVPTWEEATSYRPLADIKGTERRCQIKDIAKMNSLTALGREASLCLNLNSKTNKIKELETISLKLSDLFPDSPWGPYFLSLMANQQKSEVRSLWYLKLAQKREKNALLAYEEIRKNYFQSTDSVTAKSLIDLGGTWATIEETRFLTVLDQLKKQQCDLAQQTIKEFRSDHWKNVPFNELLNSKCQTQTAPKRALTSATNEF